MSGKPDYRVPPNQHEIYEVNLDEVIERSKTDTHYSLNKAQLTNSIERPRDPVQNQANRDQVGLPMNQNQNPPPRKKFKMPKWSPTVGQSWFMGISVAIGILLVCVLVPLSFHYVGYDEYAFVQDKYGSVHTDNVFTQGRYFATLNYEFIYFPSTFEIVETQSGVFAANGLEIILNTTFYYRLPEAKLANIYNLFSKNYDNRVNSIAKTTIKNTASQFSIEDYLTRRSEIEEILSRNVSDVLWTSIGVDAPAQYFNLVALTFPNSVIQTSLQSGIALQNNQIQGYNQTLQIVLTNTTRTVSIINANASATISNANNEANKIIQNSISEYNNIILVARGEGIEDAVESLNLTDRAVVQKFIDLTALLDNSNITMFFGNYFVQPIIH